MGLYDQIQPHDTPILGVDSNVYGACETLNNFQCHLFFFFKKKITVNLAKNREFIHGGEFEK